MHEEVIHKVIEFALENGYGVFHLEFSPIKGPEGNIEYLLHLKKGAEEILGNHLEVQVEDVVAEAHKNLD